MISSDKKMSVRIERASTDSQLAATGLARSSHDASGGSRTLMGTGSTSSDVPLQRRGSMSLLQDCGSHRSLRRATPHVVKHSQRRIRSSSRLTSTRLTRPCPRPRRDRVQHRVDTSAIIFCCQLPVRFSVRLKRWIPVTSSRRPRAPWGVGLRQVA